MSTMKGKVELEKVRIENEDYYLITNSHKMRPFFMNVVSDSNHWMFMSSNGALSAGRKNSNFALFPYYTEDKITESFEHTGSKSIIRVAAKGETLIWEPFSLRTKESFELSQNIYKSIYGNRVIVEEVNHSLNLSFQVRWSNSDQYGFVRQSVLRNLASVEYSIEVLDGIQNILPSALASDLQNSTSNLVDAYKRSELDADSGLGIFALSAVIVDRAEPSECLKANICWSLGMSNPKYLLSSLQVDAFRKGENIDTEHDVKAERGAYLLSDSFSLNSNDHKEWFIIADVNKDHVEVIKHIENIKNNDGLLFSIKKDVELGTTNLKMIVASADGLQSSSDDQRDSRHFSNTLFNVMRGGIFDNNYQIERKDFNDYLSKANKSLYEKYADKLQSLQDQFSIIQLHGLVEEVNNEDFKRLAIEYLPLKFSRRHGDPSRPWNRFSINTRSEVDGSKILDYEGNWRDIFQNWEALVKSYPMFIEGMVFKFLNATTFDGYNPYRVTKGGFDWETIEPDDPWSYIGYWGDHQIIYLLKLLEVWDSHFPDSITNFMDEDCFVYANVPYKIKSYDQILSNPKDTIDFDIEADKKIRERRDQMGADGALLVNESGDVHRVNFIEKILAPLLAKISNLIPEGGIWMNTQRPEWNDANNALVGNGISMVTLYYIRRFLSFLKSNLSETKIDRVRISNELVDFYKNVKQALIDNMEVLESNLEDGQRKKIVDELGTAADTFRTHVYKQGFWGTKRSISIEGLLDFVDAALYYVDHSIRANKRADGMYHAYNLITIDEEKMSVSYLSEMLEGQVAILSSGALSSRESLEVLDALKSSSLFREDQYSYILYPNKQLPGFLKKNNIQNSDVVESELLKEMHSNGDYRIVAQNINGGYHFNGSFKNANDLDQMLDAVKDDTRYVELVKKDRSYLHQIFENEFDHKSFTGRSGTFFGYEGLGSIYWHMVSKLSLAVQECCLKAINDGEDAELIGKLLEHYYEVNEGLGVHKSPELYGAFPTDAYSHTPFTKGAQQPGMTGQVKEDILCRFGELGVFVNGGKLYFDPCMLRQNEFISNETQLDYYDINGQRQSIKMPDYSMAFTYCQVPIVYQISDSNRVRLFKDNEEIHSSEYLELNTEFSQSIFNRDGEVDKIWVQIKSEILK